MTGSFALKYGRNHAVQRPHDFFLPGTRITIEKEAWVQ